MTPGILDNVFVDRLTWLRGTGASNSGLLQHGEMCCLGFVCEQRLGWSRGELSAALMPPSDRDWLYEPYYNGMTSVTVAMAGVNDAVHLTDSERERQLVNLGKQIGLHLIFIN